jgi:hypothetical protein
VALYLIAQVFYIFSYRPLVHTFATALLHPGTALYIPPFRAISKTSQRADMSKRHSSPNLKQLETLYTFQPIPKEQSKASLIRPTVPEKRYKTPIFFFSFFPLSLSNETNQPHQKKKNRNKYYDKLLSFLEQDRFVVGTLCVFYAIMKNQGISFSKFQCFNCVLQRWMITYWNWAG